MRWFNSEYIRCFFTIYFYDSKHADLYLNQIHTSRSRIHPRQLYGRPLLQLGNVTTAVRSSFARRALCSSFEKQVEGISGTVVIYKGCVLSPACASSAPAGSRCLSAPLPCSGNGNCGERGEICLSRCPKSPCGLLQLCNYLASSNQPWYQLVLEDHFWSLGSGAYVQKSTPNIVWRIKRKKKTILITLMLTK